MGGGVGGVARDERGGHCGGGGGGEGDVVGDVWIAGVSGGGAFEEGEGVVGFFFAEVADAWDLG